MEIAVEWRFDRLLFVQIIDIRKIFENKQKVKLEKVGGGKFDSGPEVHRQYRNNGRWNVNKDVHGRRVHTQILGLCT